VSKSSEHISHCVFCRIVSGRAPASWLFQDDLTAAFLDLFPVNTGHALVVSREHFDDLASCPPDLVARLMTVAQQLATALVSGTEADGFNVWVANGRAAGQEVFHVHLHILPRFQGDAFGLRFPKGYPTEAMRPELDELAARIRDRLER
jgi:histidine triad (HIT) family protein